MTNSDILNYCDGVDNFIISCMLHFVGLGNLTVHFKEVFAMKKRAGKRTDRKTHIEAIEKITVATGIFSSKNDLDGFLSVLSESELSKPQHYARPMAKQTTENGTPKLILYIKEHADFLIKASLFKEGMLHHWKEHFTLTHATISSASSA